MAQRLQTQGQQVVGTPVPLEAKTLPNIISTRNPTSSDLGYRIGTVWVNKKLKYIAK